MLPGGHEVISQRTLCSQKALADAAAEEDRDAQNPNPVVLSQAKVKHVPLPLTRSNAVSYRKPPLPRTKPTIRRKPLPSTARPALFAVASNLDRYASKADNDLARPSLRRAITTFDDILPIHKIDNWQDVDNAEWQRRRERSIPAFAVDTFHKAKYQVKKAIGQIRE